MTLIVLASIYYFGSAYSQTNFNKVILSQINDHRGHWLSRALSQSVVHPRYLSTIWLCLHSILPIYLSFLSCHSNGQIYILLV